jgi:organic radical activating enzyme
MSQDIYCPMIHGGININLKDNGSLTFNQCCLSTTSLQIPSDLTTFWQGEKLQSIRNINNKNIWLDDCRQCKHIESAGLKSFRRSMVEHFGVKRDLSGPLRIDFLFDRSCNLACRTCGAHSSTFWEKHLKDNNLPIGKDFKTTNNLKTIKNLLETLDLSNLEQVQFCGGETLLGSTYWETAQIIADLVPDAKDKLLLGFQTNGTQSVPEKYYDLIEKFKLVKFMISIDGIHDRFDYLRWPANWNQVVDNIFNIREKVPGNVMFYIQECTSNLNMFYFGEVGDWVAKYFNTNREGDQSDYSTQLANHSYLDVNVITTEYFDSIKNTKMFQFLRPDWQENPDKINKFIKETEKFDKLRGQDWKKTFPEVANFYSRYFK